MMICFAQNIDCFSEAFLTKTHNLCFRAKKEENVYPCAPKFHYIKVWCNGSTLHGHIRSMQNAIRSWYFKKGDKPSLSSLARAFAVRACEVRT